MLITTPLYKQKLGDLNNLDLPKKEHVVVHAPPNITLLGKHSDTLDYLVNMSHYLKTCGQHYLVVHVGSSAFRNIEDYIINLLREFIKETQGDNTILCIENSALGKNFTKQGTVKQIKTIIQSINSERVRMCFDTEHGFASGYSLNISELKSIVGLVHFNPIPKVVTFGSRVDLHSDYSLLTSTHIEDYLIPIYINFWLRVPFVVEIKKDLYTSINLFFKEVLKYGRFR